MNVRFATRGSALARAQVDLVIQRLAGVEPEWVIVNTVGDRKQELSLSELSGQGWFTGDVEAAVGNGNADAAVHSAKDLPMALAEGLHVAAYLPRADCRDAVISREGMRLAELPAGSVIGTSSVRRGSWLRSMRSDLVIKEVRGNVDTRLAKLDSGEYDALLLAAAGLDRLGLGHRITERLDAREFPPAPAQGVIAVETAIGGEISEYIASIDDHDSHAAVVAERAVLEGLGGGCLLPLGAWAEIDGDELTLHAAFGEGEELRRVTLTDSVDHARECGLQVAEILGDARVAHPAG